MDLSPFINKAGCECLNEADDHPLAHCLTPKGGYLESDCDEQVRVILSFLINPFVKVTIIKSGEHTLVSLLTFLSEQETFSNLSACTFLALLFLKKLSRYCHSPVVVCGGGVQKL